jgi:hypothetical protein
LLLDIAPHLPEYENRTRLCAENWAQAIEPFPSVTENASRIKFERRKEGSNVAIRERLGSFRF